MNEPMEYLKSSVSQKGNCFCGLVTRNGLVKAFSSILLLVSTHSALAVQSVTAIALFNDRAMLSLDGKKARIYKVGQRIDNFVLVSSDTSSAIIEIDGRRQPLSLNSGTILTKSLGAQVNRVGPARLELTVNRDGFFEVDGEVEGESLNFLVDTGANLVVLSSDAADSIDLDYSEGVRTIAATASGNSPMFLVFVDDLRIGTGGNVIELDDIQVGVIEGRFPQQPLLGMSFLSRVSMQREGDTMVLTR